MVGAAGYPAIKSAAKTSGATTWPPRLRTIRLDGTSVDGPAEKFWYAYPRAATDDAGTLHVVWAEPDEKLPGDPYTLHGRLPTLRSVWYAARRDGSWSRATRIYRGEQLQWDDLKTSRLIVDDQRGLHIAFAAEDSSGSGLVYLSALSAPDRHWRSTMQRLRMGVGYLDLAVGSDRQVAIVFISGIAFPRPRVDVLSVTQSVDGGRSWTSPAEISTPEEEPAIEPHVFYDRGSALRLEWVQQPSGTFMGGSLWQTTLTGLDRRSTTALALPSDVMTSHSQAAIDACGTMHVFTQAYVHGMPELRYARTTLNGWSRWSRPFDIPGAQASIAASGAVVHVVWKSISKSTTPERVSLSGLAHAALRILGPRSR